MKHLFYLLMTLLGSTPALSATYYVGGSGASNGNSGSAANPWATLQFAADSIAAGDIVMVRAGNYQGFHLTTSGTQGNRIAFQGEPGAIINQVNPVTPDGINLELVSYITIEGFTLIGTGNDATSRAGIRLVGEGFANAAAFSQGVIIRHNTARDWGKWGILTGFADDVLIEFNTTENSFDEHGIYVSNSGDRPIIRHNRIVNNNANGIHLNGDLNTGNTALPEVDGIISDALIDSNIIIGNGVGGGSGINGDGAQNAQIQNNVLLDNHASGISLYQIDGGGPSVNGVIVNNTIINANDARWVINLQDGASGATIFNNILFNLNISTFRGSILADDGSDVGLNSDFNLLDPRFQTDDNFAAFDLSSWQGLGFDLNSQALTEPQLTTLFTNLASQDVTLATGSAAVDFGVAMLGGESAPHVDRQGTLRPQGASPDVGAFEFDLGEGLIFSDGFEG